MSICLLLISDGRSDYLDRTLKSLADTLSTVDRVIHVDDSDHRLGFAGAVEHGWRLITNTDAEFVFHVEADFLFHQPPPIERMAGLLERERHLAQVALKRQPWNDEERAAGGIVECHPDDFETVTDGEDVWTEHRRFFTTNPSVYPARWCRMGWPQESESEGVFTHRLLADPLLRFAFWGAKHDPPLVEHIGAERLGHSY